MNAKLVLSLVLALVLTACSGAVPVTVDPTVVPTDDLPTAITSPTPIEVPTATPTEVPTLVPTSTEIPLYVGLPADEVEVMREQCLQENPDSACLPLPFEPAQNVEVRLVSNPAWPGVTISDGEGDDRLIAFEIPAGTDLLSPLAAQIEIKGYFGGGTRWLGLPGRSVEGLDSVDFGLGPFNTYDFGEGPIPFPSILLRLRRNDGSCYKPYGERPDNKPLFEEGDLSIPAGNRQAVMGELLVRTETQVCLEILVYKPVRFFFTILPGEVGGTPNGTYPVGRTNLSDPLTTSVGQIVYVKPLVP